MLQSLTVGLRRRWRRGIAASLSILGTIWLMTEILTRVAHGADHWLDAHGTVYLVGASSLALVALVLSSYEARSVSFTLPNTGTTLTLRFADATLGQTGQAHFFMPLEDSAVVTDAASAYRYTGGAPSLERAYTSGGDVFGVEFPLNGLSSRLPTAADTTLPHFLEGGNTALRLGRDGGGGYLVNPTREFVVPGGGSMPSGSTLFKIGPNGTRIPIRGW